MEKTSDIDIQYMNEAILEAEAATVLGEIPVGAVIVRNGEIISRAHNMVESYRSSSAHAELLAIEAAEALLGAKWLMGCTLYVTLEPCAMCAGAIVLARIDRLVIGTFDKKTGACGSVLNIANNPDLNHRIEIVPGVEQTRCSELLTTFFREMRVTKEQLKNKIKEGTV